MSAPSISDSGRRPSWTRAFAFAPGGGNDVTVFSIDITLVVDGVARAVPVALYLQPSEGAGKYGSALHARCEETGMLLSWLLRRGCSLDELAAELKPFSVQGGPGLALFAVRAARALAAEVQA
ncbi:MAG: hypothetical protein ING19_02670 [Azospirillum sp.]|nr:hypothetical protein [Azospirillum sp.]